MIWTELTCRFCVARAGLTVAGQYGFYTAGNDEQYEHTFEWTDTGTPYRGN